MPKTTPAVLAAIAAIAAASATSAATLYSNDFSTNTNGFSGAVALTTSPSGESFLGPLYNGGTTTLSLASAGYNGLSVSFDIYVIGSMDGDGQYGGGPDPFVVTNDGAAIFNQNFANFDYDTQNYPVAGSAPTTGAAAVGTLGYSGYPGTVQDSIYAFTLPLTASGVTTIAFSGDSDEELGNEFYGIDNVVVSGTPPATMSGAPEPSTWALMFAGLAFIGGALRSRRRSIVAAVTA